jgi:hypothetical protein
MGYLAMPGGLDVDVEFRPNGSQVVEQVSRHSSWGKHPMAVPFPIYTIQFFPMGIYIMGILVEKAEQLTRGSH